MCVYALLVVVHGATNDGDPFLNCSDLFSDLSQSRLEHHQGPTCVLRWEGERVRTMHGHIELRKWVKSGQI